MSFFLKKDKQLTKRQKKENKWRTEEASKQMPEVLVLLRLKHWVQGQKVLGLIGEGIQGQT
jgi:hypothetical protein